MLSRLIKNEFSLPIRSRGEAYYKQGRVSKVKIKQNLVEGRVSGSEVYSASISYDQIDECFCFDCDCPFSSGFDICKHLWALALECDSQIQRDPSLMRLILPRDVYETYIDIQPVKKDKVAENKPKPEWKKQLDNLDDKLKRSATTSLQKPTVKQWNPERELVYMAFVDPNFSDEPQSIRLTIGTRGKNRSHTPKESLRELRPNSESWLNSPGQEDAYIRQLLLGTHYTPPPYEYTFTSVHRDIYISPFSYDLIIKAICQTNRAYIGYGLRSSSNELNDLIPLNWDADVPYRLSTQLSKKSDLIKIAAVLERGTESIGIQQLSQRIGDEHFLTHDGLLIRIDLKSSQPNFTALRQLQSILIPANKASSLANILGRLHGINLSVDALLPMRVENTEPKPHLTVVKDEYSQSFLAATLAFNYGLAGRIVYNNPASSCVSDSDDGVVMHPRDVQKEQFYQKRLTELGVETYVNYYHTNFTHRLRHKVLPKMVRTLISDGWTIEAEGQLYRSAGVMNISVSSGIDWFDVKGNATFEDQSADLPSILRAIQQGETTIQLDDGTIGLLPEEWLKKYGPLSHSTEWVDGQARFKKNQAFLLDILLTELPNVDIDAQFKAARKQLNRFDKIKPLNPPKSFKTKLRSYQSEGLGWLNYLNQFGLGGCLADDMGLGKTIQVLALLEQQRLAGNGPSLVVVPRSLIFNWMSEASKFTPQMRVLDQSGSERIKSSEHLIDFDLILTTYGTLRSDAEYFKDFEFNYAILDEAQAIKNSTTASAKAARLLRAKHRLCMSGTPIENHLGELWSLFEFMNPGMLGNTRAFKAIATADTTTDDGRALMARIVKPFMLRRTKSQVATDLPERVEQIIHCELETKQRKVYDELLQHYRASLNKHISKFGVNKSQIQILEALLRLRQAAIHPALVNPATKVTESAKLKLLMEKITLATEEGHKSLVFSQFTSFLSIVRNHLDQQGIVYEYLDGKTKNRQQCVDRYQNDPKCPVFLISLKAGGVGLNLTAADYVFLLDPWWNPAVEAQAIDRTHRIGQYKTVFAYRLISKDTVEEKVLELQRTKKELAEAIIGHSEAMSSSITKDDLALLLS